MNYLTVSAEE